MADPDAARTKKVSQSGIDEIKKLGMSAALKKYTAGGNSSEFTTAMERYYGSGHLKNASKNSGGNVKTQPISSTKAKGPPGGKDPDSVVKKPKPVPMPASAPAAAARASGKKSTTEKILGKKNVAAVGKATKPVGKLISSIGANSKGISGAGVKDLSGAAKKLGLNNPFKPRKRK